MTISDEGTNSGAADPQQGHVDDPAAVNPSPNPAEAANAEAASDPFTALTLEQDTREWLAKRGTKSVEDAIQTAYEQSKLLGNAVRVPGKDAKPEEVEAFYEKLGRPKTADDYDFRPPESLPENLPYDGERAKSFAAVAHKIGLSKAQAAAVHDWAVENAVNDFNGYSAQSAEERTTVAKTETAKLEKLWGPLDGDAMRVNLGFADKVIRELGGDEVLSEFQRVGLIGSEGSVIMSAPIAVMLSKIGSALYKEDGVVRGRPDRIGNPFAEGDGFNVTAQMKIVREDKDHAMALIAAAGKKPEDFGLKG